MSAAIQAVRLSKSYGTKQVVDNLDLDVPEGSIFGFLGANGAGKTTTLRLITGLARPTVGTIRVFGQDVTTPKNTVRSQIGFLPDVPSFYGWMTAPEFLHLAGGLFGMSGAELDQRSEMLLDLAGLSGVNSRISGFSRGMKQRLGIAQALINAPRLLLLDEPTSALDPMGRKDVLEMIQALRGRTTVFFSTHILSDVERVCDTVAILDHGRLVTQAPIVELKARYSSQKIRVRVSDKSQELATAIDNRPWASAITVGEVGLLEITVSDVIAAQREIPAMVAASGSGLVLFEAAEIGLEEVFVDLVGAQK